MDIEQNVMVPMRDGVHLATDIYRPCNHTEPLPVILERTPYDKTKPSRSEVTASQAHPKSREEIALAFVERGYVVVYQDCRGRFNSQGTFSKYVNEGYDGFDTLEWLCAQPWCNGRIGTMGLSYAAHTQSAMACLNPPGLACMFLDSGGFSSAFQGGIRQGGAFELKQLTWAYHQSLADMDEKSDSLKKAALEEIDIKDWFTRLPWKKGHSPLQYNTDYEDYVFEQWHNETFSDYWRQIGLYAEGYYKDYADVPMLHMSSWYDAYSRTAADNFCGLSSLKKGPVHLLMGPWTHGNRSVSYHGEVDFGPEATLDGNLAADHVSFRLAWFDRWLKGIDPKSQQDQPVKLFIMGGGSGRCNERGHLVHGGTWRTESNWPLPRTEYRPFYLHVDGLLDPIAPNAENESLSYQYDPSNPVPTIGGTMTSGEPVMTGGAYNQVEAERFFGCRPPFLPLSSRQDVLVFQTAPLQQDTEVTGPIAVHLWLSSDCADTDITIKLIDCYPPSDDFPRGFAMNITDGLLRVRFRNSWMSPEWMEPGKIYQLKIEPFPTANLFKKGHRIRLDISSSNFPHFDVNPNTGEPAGKSSTSRIALNRIFMDRSHPSHVILPIIPTS